MSLRIVPLTLAQANSLVASLHRHHKPVVGHRFSIGAEADGKLVGAAIVGRPVAGNRMVGNAQYMTAEVTRLVTDGTKNACSILYAAAARTAREMGFDSIQTYTLEQESGTSLRAAGWTLDGVTSVTDWESDARKGQLRLDGRMYRDDQPMTPKSRWVKRLRVVKVVPESRP